jgi:SAM-dependent methyltransferase
MDSNFDSNYYNREYFVTVNGKKFQREDGTECGWSYANSQGEWHGCAPICGVWKNIFGLSGSSKVLDVGCGRGTFIAYLVDLGINAEGFDFSEFSVMNPYSRCPKERIRCHDATLTWPYSDKSFDLVTVLDLYEHIYETDIDKVIYEMLRVSGKYIFLQIATVGGGSGSGIHDKGYILKRGEKIPVRLEGCAVAGHVTVQNKQFWIDRLLDGITRSSEKSSDKWKFRDDLVGEFVKKVDPAILSNWTKNTLLILEKTE